MSDGEVKGSFYRTEIIAQLFGVTVRRVQQLTQEGIISTTKILEDGKSVRRYDLVPTIQAYVKYLSDKAYGKQHRTDKEIELREQKMQADIALKESQGELHRLKTEIGLAAAVAADTETWIQNAKEAEASGEQPSELEILTKTVTKQQAQIESINQSVDDITLAILGGE